MTVKTRREPLFAFDIDGVVVDSEETHFRALQKVLGEATNAPLPAALIGLSLEETLSTFGVDPTRSDEIAEQVERAYIETITSAQLRPGIVETIRLLEKHDCAYGFVSSASRQVCEANLRFLNISADYPLVSRDDVKVTKPNAEPYLKLCSMVGIDPAETIVVEDSDVGIEGAHKAGIRKIYAWPHHLSTAQTYRLGSRKIENLREISEIENLRSAGTTRA